MFEICKYYRVFQTDLMIFVTINPIDKMEKDFIIHLPEEVVIDLSCNNRQPADLTDSEDNMVGDLESLILDGYSHDYRIEGVI